jgi:signal transduction histidine kinase/CheY-like chemotaxis protein
VSSGKWAVRIDAKGRIQPLDGQPSDSGLLADICGANPARAAMVNAGIRAVGAGQADTFSLEFPWPWPDSEMRVRVVATPYRQGAVAGVLLTRTEAGAPPDTRDGNQDFKMEALGRLAGGVAHDFANLITLISGYSDILLSRVDAHDASRPELEQIRRAAARGAGVTAQILDYVREQVAPSTMVRLNELVADMVRLLRPIIGEHIRLAVTADPNLGAVEADFAQMSRVFMNLVLNARDAMPRGGTISIRTANMHLSGDGCRKLPAGPYVMLEVSDTGIGMDAQTLQRIFQPFFTTKDRAGTGLGLTTVQHIVEQAGGGVWARSEPGQGATFTVSLPRAGQGVEAADPDSLPRAPSAGTETILLAEDEDSVRKLLRYMLDSNGYRVIEAADGCDALRLFQQHAGSIDLLLTDVIMPGLNGSELVRKARASQPGLKVIYMSGYTDDVLLKADAIGPGMSFVRKPLKLDILAAVIREVLDNPAPH